ncbi:MAG: ClbS/DfsB family four-helix bundle protein [Chloroflexi bacterium]|nr:ClbS/DfsB family four-helix bundle protein [Chloroflexota bacterium]MCH8875564.1 ClbS/DfsB family four-helix bundle protein [Chloroflexota bacterium]MCI0875355.1 ClbS/DfsB family four-helix bundle protein [Chloroflexota bacterium]
MNVRGFQHFWRKDRAEWERVLAEVGEDRMLEPGLPGGWSVKDTIAHVNWYEREMVRLLEKPPLTRSELWELPTDARNVPIYEAGKDQPLEQVLTESNQLFERLWALVSELPDEDLVDCSRFKQMPEEGEPWKVIASNTYEHYRQHIPDIRAWLSELADNS